MKISILVFLSISLSNCFISTSVIRNTRTKLYKQSNPNSLLNSTKSNKGNPPNLVSSNNCTTNSRENSIKDSSDLIEKYSDWFGLFPREQKWKSIRFTFYSISAGYCLSAGMYEFIHSFLENPLEDYFQ